MTETTESQTPGLGWRPLTREQRRVAGVLVEKAKTTPDAYPMTLNAITTACNQKSNRAPLMELDVETVEATLDQLREMGAVTEVQGSGRTVKYRHNLYQWLGVEKVEMAVMAELMLRGQQTLGELRGRASRMEPIADLNELKPVLQSLLTKKLIIELTPPGRGQMVTHNLYFERELEKIREIAGRESEVHERDPENVPTFATEKTNFAPIQGQFDAQDLQSQIDQLRVHIDDLSSRLERIESLLH